MDGYALKLSFRKATLLLLFKRWLCATICSRARFNPSEGMVVPDNKISLKLYDHFDVRQIVKRNKSLISSFTNTSACTFKLGENPEIILILRFLAKYIVLQQFAYGNVYTQLTYCAIQAYSIFFQSHLLFSPLNEQLSIFTLEYYSLTACIRCTSEAKGFTISKIRQMVSSSPLE